LQRLIVGYFGDATSVARRLLGEQQMKHAKFPLRILLVAERQTHASPIERALLAVGHNVTGVVSATEDLALAAQRFQPDALLVEVETSGRELLRTLRRVYERRPLPMIVFVDRSAEEDIRTAIKGGVSAYVVDGLRANRVIPVLEAAVTRFLEFQALRSERDEALAKLTERRVIERAKGILMRRRDLPEDDAYDVLRKMAMNRGRRMVEVAESIITAEEALAEH